MKRTDGCGGTPGWFYRLSQFFRNNLGFPVYKIPLDAGLTCPNRDGSIGVDGCSYCSNPSFSHAAGIGRTVMLAEQIQRGKKKISGKRYLAYFQAYTNTYAPVEQLKALYEEALLDPDVIGLSISTRPDCISPEILDLLQGYARTKHIWIEYGLQSAHDCTLERINRRHTFTQFREAMQLTRGRGIFTCAHVILGLPGETQPMMLETMKRINQCGLDGVKFHHLQVIAGTPLAEEFARGAVPVFKTAAEYIPLLCDCLERLDRWTTIHRLAARAADQSLLIAPYWNESATQIASAVEGELKRRGTWQGKQESGVRSQRSEEF